MKKKNIIESLMFMIPRVKNYLRQPYPNDSDAKRKWLTIFAVGLFVVTFIWLFDLNIKEGISNLFIILGFGIITICVMILNKFILPYLFPKIFLEESWSIGKEILFHLWTIFLIGISNLLYANWGGYYEIGIYSFLLAQLETLLIGIFPSSFIVLYKHNHYLKKNINTARELIGVLQTEDEERTNNTKNNQEQFISLSSETGKDKLQIKMNDFFFVKSIDNYIEVYWNDRNSTRKSLLRGSLKRIEKELNQYSSLFRCHRTYIININKVDRISGNSQGYRLRIGADHEIPVARSYIKAFQKFIN